MPQLKAKIIVASNAAGERLSLSFSASVSENGTFKLRIPTEMVGDEHFIDALRRQVRNGIDAVSQERVHCYVIGSVMDALAHAVQVAMKDYLTVDIKKELVIAYATDLKVSFWENPNGSISQNGYTGEKAGYWCQDRQLGDLSATQSVPAFRVGLYARVWECTTYTRGNATRAVYASPDKLPADGEELNAFCGLRIPAEAISSGFSDDMSVHTMPYSDEAALFFTNALLGICRLARQVNNFFGNAEQLQLAIARHENLLPAPAEKATT